MSGEPDPAPQDREPPPVFGSWSRAYAIVLGELAIVVALLYALTRWAE
jgi:hypothetical protein